ncbi:hypothetical protein L1987_70600 [Smallanthus sonchifolius]|uniref:Uncharacterized protein n=1 Tax=Smallanthus sonchifolius TaxID=185202 RepID=A0ACB9AQP7_9ASTR|nr:hypothetical protein L1987_70600 [Smallanthus sonchifolius]
MLPLYSPLPIVPYHLHLSLISVQCLFHLFSLCHLRPLHLSAVQSSSSTSNHDHSIYRPSDNLPVAAKPAQNVEWIQTPTDKIVVTYDSVSNVQEDVCGAKA